MRYFPLLLLYWVFSSFSLIAQSRSALNGIVTDERNLPLPGATIMLNNGEQATLSGKEGRFVIPVPDSGLILLKVTYVGCQPAITEIHRDSLPVMLTIQLLPEIQSLSEVIIRDRYADQRRKEKSQGIEVVDQKYLRQNLSGSLMKTLERLPGVTTVDIGSGQSKPVIRGLGFNRVVVAEQGVKHEAQQWGADHGLEIDQYAVERVEVIKGPASLIYGSDAIGGLIELNQVFIPEPHSFGGTVDLTGKSNNALIGGSLQLYGRTRHLYVKSRITAIDYADYRVPVDSVTINSYRVPLDKNRLRNTAGEEYNGHLTLGLIRNRFSSALYLSNYYSKSGFFANAHGIMPLTADSTYDNSNRDIQLPYQWVNHAKTILRIVVFHRKAKTEWELGYQKNFRRELSQYIGHGYMPATLPDSLGFRADLAREFRKNTFSLNQRTSFPVAEKHTLTTGLNAEYQRNRIGGWGFIIPSFDQVSGGFFILEKSNLMDHLTIEGGIRYDIGWVRIMPYFDWFKTPVIEGNDTTGFTYAQRSQSMERTFGSFSWSAGLNYSTDAVTLRANLGKSYRMPIPKELAVNGVNYHYFIYEKGDPGLSPEVSYQLDAGVAWQIPTFAIEVNPFVNYFPNYIYLNPTFRHDYTYGAGNQIYQYTQCEVFRFGGELHMHYKPLRFIMTGLIAEYVYSRQLSGDKKGFTLPFSPPTSFIVNLKYLPGFRKILNNTYVSLDVQLTAAQNQVVPPEMKTPGYISVNVSMGTDLLIGNQPVSFTVHILNLFNSTYYNHASFYRILDIPEPGRNISLNLFIPFTNTKKNTLITINHETP